MKNHEELGKKIYEKIWQGWLWGRDGALALAKKRFYQQWWEWRRRDGLSALSSAYYTAAGNAFARSGEGSFFTRLSWLSKGVWCLMVANVYSNELKIRRGGLKKMTPDELDVRSRICFKSRYLKEALRCSEEALSRWGLTTDTRVLLLMGKAEILDARHKGEERSGEVERTYNDALRLRRHIKPTSDVRLLKSYGAYLLKWGYPGGAEGVLAKAAEIARRYGLGDQEVKILPLLAEAQRQMKAGISG